MKLEKLDNRNPIELKPIVDKINLLIDLMVCSKCGHIKGLIGEGLCYKCTEEFNNNL